MQVHFRIGRNTIKKDGIVRRVNTKNQQAHGNGIVKFDDKEDCVEETNYDGDSDDETETERHQRKKMKDDVGMMIHVVEFEKGYMHGQVTLVLRGEAFRWRI